MCHIVLPTTRIAADGKCFFRSISLVVTGSQDFHQELRLLITTHMIHKSKNPVFSSLVSSDKSMEQCIHTFDGRHTYRKRVSEFDLPLSKTFPTVITFTPAYMKPKACIVVSTGNEEAYRSNDVSTRAVVAKRGKCIVRTTGHYSDADALFLNSALPMLMPLINI